MCLSAREGARERISKTSCEQKCQTMSLLMMMQLMGSSTYAFQGWRTSTIPTQAFRISLPQKMSRCRRKWLHRLNVSVKSGARSRTLQCQLRVALANGVRDELHSVGAESMSDNRGESHQGVAAAESQMTQVRSGPATVDEHDGWFYFQWFVNNRFFWLTV